MMWCKASFRWFQNFLGWFSVIQEFFVFLGSIAGAEHLKILVAIEEVLERT